MKIAHIVRRFTFSEWGGTETAVWQIARRQKKQGLSPEILCTAALDRAGSEIIDGIPIRRFPCFYPCFPLSEADRLALDKKGGDPFAPKMMKVLREGDYEIFHIHAGGRLARSAARIGKKRNIPRVMSLHGGSCVIPPQEMEQMLRPLKHKFRYGNVFDRLRGLAGPPERLMDVLLALSREEAEALKIKFPEIAVEVFPNGIEHRELPAPEEFRRRYGIPEKRRLILCISRIDYQKNQKLLLKLLERTSSTHLLLIGPITAAWYYEELLALAETLGVSGRLTVIPGLSPDSPELLRALRCADCFVLPSRHEPFGIAALEALDAGVPLIASRVGGLKDFLIDRHNALLFEDDDPDSLLEAFHHLDPLRTQLIRAGHETAERYNWESLVQTLTGIYRRMR